MQVVRDVINAGVDGYDEDLKARVRKASQGLRLTRDASMDIVSKAVGALIHWLVNLTIRESDSYFFISRCAGS